MKRMVDNKKAESIGLNEFIVDTTNNKRYYATISISFEGNAILDYNLKLNNYLLLKHITKTEVFESIEEFLNIVHEHCGAISIDKYITYDNTNNKFVCNSLSVEGVFTKRVINFSQYIQDSATKLEETIDKDSEPSLLAFTITDLTTGNYIMLDI